MSVFDYCFIGAGITNLYAAYRILQKEPSAKIVLLEANKEVGGRVAASQWKGTTILHGAGIMRMKKDKRLAKLLTELGLSPMVYTSKIGYSPLMTTVNEGTVPKYHRRLSQNLNSAKNQTFKAWATKVLSRPKYQEFSTAVGYTDYEKADPIDTVRHYGFDDTYSGYQGGRVPWVELLSKLVEVIGDKRIQTKTTVQRIHQMKGKTSWCVDYTHHSKSEFLEARNVFVGTTVNQALKMLPRTQKRSLLKDGLRSQPFVRVYAQIDPKASQPFIEAVQSYIVLPNELQKIIPIQPGSVYMIAYSDNKKALQVKPHLGDLKWFETKAEEGLGLAPNSIKIKALKHFWWQEGTHYFTPLSQEFPNRNAFLKEVQHQASGLFVVGEGLSNEQGWVEGALESVEAVI
jgi:hypothetical protein